YIGKIGVVKGATKDSIQVTFFIWGATETLAKEGKSPVEACRNTVVEATYTWHPKSVVLAKEIYLLDGDRAIMIRDKDLSKVSMVSIRTQVDEGTFILRLPRAEPINWKQSDNPNDVILPIYSGWHLQQRFYICA
ncbi:unnamed protein product, partial [Gongylonema pulchrum]|uniref:C2 domain-containing protein n=1 Tax=Gongylonema pulchrum TaxID=637853 RepID=A0A183DU56_9BILA